LENEKKFKALEKERTNALEVATETYEEREAKASAKESLILVRFSSNLLYSTKTSRIYNFNIERNDRD